MTFRYRSITRDCPWTFIIYYIHISDIFEGDESMLLSNADDTVVVYSDYTWKE